MQNAIVQQCFARLDTRDQYVIEHFLRWLQDNIDMDTQLFFDNPVNNISDEQLHLLYFKGVPKNRIFDGLNDDELASIQGIPSPVFSRHVLAAFLRLGLNESNMRTAAESMPEPDIFENNHNAMA